MVDPILSPLNLLFRQHERNQTKKLHLAHTEKINTFIIKGIHIDRN